MSPSPSVPLGTFEITPYRVVVPLVALFFFLYVWSCVFRGTKTIWEAFLWTLFWGGVVVIVLFPRWIGLLTMWTGIRGQANAVFAITIGILLFIVFHMLIRIEKLQKRLTDLVRHEALEDAGLLREAPKSQVPRPQASTKSQTYQTRV